MKYIKFIFMVLTTVTLFSCSDTVVDLDLFEINEPGKALISVSDFQYEENTRASLSVGESSVKFSWSDKDTVGIFPDYGDQISFVIESGTGDNKAVFDGGAWALKSSHNYYSYFPFSRQNFLIEGANKKIPVCYIGQKQKKANETSHLSRFDYMAASGMAPVNSALNFEFDHLGALLIINIKSPCTTTYKQINISTESGSFTTRGTVDLTSPQATIQETEASQYMTLDLADVEIVEGETAQFYMMIAPVDLSGSGNLIFELTTTEGIIFSTNVVAKNYQAGRAYMINATSLGSDISSFSIDSYPATRIDNHSGFISVQVPYGIDLSNSVVNFTLKDGVTLFSNEEEQKSGVSRNDFTKPVVFKTINSTGTENTFIVSICYSNLPAVFINTENAVDIKSKELYLNSDVFITNTENNLRATAQTKGRGNATWKDYPKKPYKLKFSKKQSVLNFEHPNKNWILLADYCDKSLLRTSYMVETAKVCGLEYNIEYHPVDLFINGEYKGVYTLTEHVEKSKNRINIDNDGFIIEDDRYWSFESLYFQTETNRYNFTFKYPDADDAEIVSGDDNYIFITSLLNNFEVALYSDNFTDPIIGYRKYINVESWAKWFLAAELIGNLEPNLYYVLKNRESKLEMYPMWDSEWSMGLAALKEDDWDLNPQTKVAEVISWNTRKYFKRLFEDEYFRNIIKSEWIKIKPQTNLIKERVLEVENKIRISQQYNFMKWPILGKKIAVGLIAFDTWEEEVDYINNFFDKRVDIFDFFIMSL